MSRTIYEPDWSIGIPKYRSMTEVLKSYSLYIIYFREDENDGDGLAPYSMTIVNTRYVCEIYPSDNWVSARHPDVCACPITLDIKRLEDMDVEWIVVVDRSGRR